MRALLLASLLAGATPALAEPGRTALSFLERPLDARAAGMGGAFSAVSGHLGALQFNPASLASLPAPSLTTTYVPGFGGGHFGFLAYGHPLGRWGTLSAGAQYFNAGQIRLNLSDGTSGSATAEEDTVALFSYAVEPAAGLGLGASYKYVRSTLAAAARATASLWDLGLLWRTGLGGLELGGAWQNLGPDVKFESSGDPPPRTLRYGASYHVPPFPAKRLDPGVDAVLVDFLFSAEVAETLQAARSPRLGLEMGVLPSFVNRFALRFGWQFNRSAEGFAFGAGLREGRYALDYAFGVARDLENTHQASLSILF